MGQTHKTRARHSSFQDETMHIGFLDFVTRPPLKIPLEYKVKSPPLGRGPYGELREALHTTLKQRRLIKIVYKTQYSEEELDKVRDEYKILQKLDHPSIMKIYQNSQDDRYIYIIMEYFKGRELFDKLRAEGPIRDDRLASKILLQILHVLKYIHSKNIVYRDLKLENILYNGKQVKLFDFTLAIEPKTKYIKDFIGTLHYIAPEVIKGKYDHRCDLWSFGVLMFMLLSGKAPFTGATDAETIDKILHSEPNLTGVRMNEYAQDLVLWILKKKAKHRPTINEIEEHPYFKQSEVKEINEVKIIFAEIYQNLKSFKFRSEVQLAIYLFIVRQIEDSIENKNILDQIFRLIDQKGEGSITQVQFKNFVDKYQLELNKNDIRQIFLNLDINQTNTIEYYEFLAGSINRDKLLSDKNLKLCFDYFDIDKSKNISVDNLKSIFAKVNENTIEEFFKEFQVQYSSGISFKDFCSIMRSMVNSGESNMKQEP